MLLISTLFLATFSFNIFQPDLGIAFQQRESILFASGFKEVIWNIMFVSPCANISQTDMFEQSNCDTKEKTFLSQSKILLATCEETFRSHVYSLQQILPHTRKHRARRQSIILPTLGIFSEFLFSLHNNHRTSKLQKQFSDFSKWSEQQVTDLSKNLVYISTLANRNSQHVNAFMTAVCESLEHDKDVIMHNHLDSILSQYYDELMSSIIAFSNDNIPLHSKFYLDLIRLCKNMQNRKLTGRQLDNYCTRIIRAPIFKLKFDSLQVLNGTVPAIQLSLNLKIPLLSNKFSGFSTYEITNTGYFKNLSHFMLRLPRMFIAKDFEVISLDPQCDNSICHIKTLNFDSKAVCLSNIISNSTLNFCDADLLHNSSCLAKNLDSGLLITAAKGIVVYSTHATKNIKFSSDILIGEGRFVCDVSPTRTLSYIFNTEPTHFKTYIFLNEVSDQSYRYINVTESRLDKLELSQSTLIDSHWSNGKYLSVDNNVLLLSIVLIIIAFFAILYKSQNQRILTSFAKLRAHCGAKWC